ncbi:MAG: DUF4917 family protein [Proteobacteria bacterium]|nr:DUF4917 family protein [Pseudomonadota bacterium]
MTIDTSCLTYLDVLKELGDRRKHLLLGNGFSIGCDPRFAYASLYDHACEAGLSDSAKRLFDRLGTNNFEGVMRALDDAQWVAEEYELLQEGDASAILDDLELVKTALISAVGEVHPEDASCLSVDRVHAGRAFIAPYFNVFTVNYDLLLYWLVAAGDFKFQDGFGTDPDDYDARSLIFEGSTRGHDGIYFLHGALHLFRGRSFTRKHSWSRTGTKLTELVKTGLAEKQYPLFVAEGTWEKKLAQIARSHYLAHCYDKLTRIQNGLVCYGLSLGESDGHLTRAIAHNLDLKRVFIGVFDDFDGSDGLALRARAGELSTMREKALGAKKRDSPELQVSFFDAKSADAWKSRMPE